MSNYVYTPLSELEDGEQVNIYGVIVALSEISTVDRTGQYERTIELRDESLDPDQLPIRCKLFSNSRRIIDRPVLTQGDIFRIHRARCKKDFALPTDLIVQGAVGMAGCNFVVWEPLIGGNLVPKDKSSANCTLAESDKERVRSLRLWYKELRGRKRNIAEVEAESENNGAESPQKPNTQSNMLEMDSGGGFVFRDGVTTCSLARFPRFGYRDILVQVLGVVQSQSKPDVWAVRAWDGTVPSTKVVTVKEINVESSKLLGEEECREFQNLIVDIFVWDEFQDPAQELEIGDVALFQNVHHYFLKSDGMHTLSMHTNRSLLYQRKITKISPEIAAPFLAELEERKEGIRRRKALEQAKKQPEAMDEDLEETDPDLAKALEMCEAALAGRSDGPSGENKATETVHNSTTPNIRCSSPEFERLLKETEDFLR